MERGYMHHSGNALGGTSSLEPTDLRGVREEGDGTPPKPMPRGPAANHVEDGLRKVRPERQRLGKCQHTGQTGREGRRRRRGVLKIGAWTRGGGACGQPGDDGMTNSPRLKNRRHGWEKGGAVHPGGDALHLQPAQPARQRGTPVHRSRPRERGGGEGARGGVGVGQGVGVGGSFAKAGKAASRGVPRCAGGGDYF